MPLYVPAGALPLGSVSAAELADDAATQAELDTHAALTAATSAHSLTKGAAYTQTYSTAARTHVAGALSENVTVTLLTDVPALINSTNTAVNEVKKLTNSLIDDSQAAGLSS